MFSCVKTARENGKDFKRKSLKKPYVAIKEF